MVKHTETDGILFMDILRKSRIFDIFAIISYTVIIWKWAEFVESYYPNLYSRVLVVNNITHQK